MAFAVFLIVLVAVAVVSSAGAWFARCRSGEATGSQAASLRPVDPCAISEAISRGDSHGERVEAELAAWLLAGHVSAEQYRQDMAVLAARDSSAIR